MAGDDENIRIRAELEGALTRDAHLAADAIDEMGDEAQQTAAQLAIMEAAMRGSSRQSRDLAADQKKVSAETSMFGRDAERSASKVDKLGESMAKLDDRLKSVKKQKFDFRKILNLYKIPAIITAVGILATALSGLGAAAFAAIAGMSPLVGVMTALPAALMTGVQAFAAARLATMGLGEAVKALAEGDTVKIVEAMGKLSPAMQQVARDAYELGSGPIRDLRDQLGEAIGPGLSAFLRESLPLWDTLQAQLGGTGEVLGSLAASAGAVMGSPAFNGQLSRIMSSNNQALLSGGQAAGYFGKMMLNLLEAFGPTFQRIATSTKGVAMYLEQATAAGLETGKLGAFFERGWDRAKAFGDVIADVAVALFNTGKAAGVMGDFLGDSITDAAQKWRDWTSSIEGQASLEQYFADAIPVVQAILGLLGGLGKAFASLSNTPAFVPTINAITTELLPALSQATDAVGTHFGPALVAAATAVVKLVAALAYSPLADILMVVARTVGLLADGLAALPGPVRYVIGGILALSVAMRLMNLAAVATRSAFSPLTGLVTGWTGQAAERAAAASREMTRFETAGQRAKTVMMTGSAGSGFLGALGGPWGVAITAAVGALTVFAAKQAEAKAQVEALSASLDQQTGALTSGSYAQILDSIGTDWIEYAESVGISQEEVIAAVVQGGDAIKDLEAKAAGSTTAMQRFFDGANPANLFKSGTEATRFSGTLTSVRANLDEATAATQRKAAADRQGQAALSGQAAAAARAAGAHRMSAAALIGQGVPAAAAGKAAADNLAAAVGREAAAARRAAAGHNAAAAGARNQTGATYALNQAAVSTIGGQIGFRQAVADTAKNLKRGAGNMSLYTQAGRDNQGAMIRVAEAAANVGGSARKQQAALKEARSKIAGWAQEAGAGAGAAKKYADRIINLTREQGKIPKKKSTDYSAPGLSGVLTTTRELVSAQNQIDRNVSVTNTITTVRKEIGGPRRHGGAVGPSRNLVGEAGPELYLRAAGGPPQIVGARGPEFRTFKEPGWIVPNHELSPALIGAAAATDRKLPSAVLRALDSADAAPPVQRMEAPAPVVTVQAPSAPSVDDLPPIHVDVRIDGNVDPSTDPRIKAVIKAAVAEALREDRERRINWRAGV